jgi:hypothetical protein
MTEHTRKARKRRTLTRKERTEIVEGLRDSARAGGNSMTDHELRALASELERATIIIEVPQ